MCNKTLLETEFHVPSEKNVMQLWEMVYLEDGYMPKTVFSDS